tara:strand:+ start:16649 stop:16966 length:318 start_codon:yes stop_codon:yes gene_type:complete
MLGLLTLLSSTWHSPEAKAANFCYGLKILIVSGLPKHLKTKFYKPLSGWGFIGTRVLISVENSGLTDKVSVPIYIGNMHVGLLKRVTPFDVFVLQNVLKRLGNLK